MSHLFDAPVKDQSHCLDILMILSNVIIFNNRFFHSASYIYISICNLICYQKIGSIVQLVRQYNGLISLQRNPLCRHVLRPQNARVFQTLHQIPSMSDQVKIQIQLIL